MCGIIGYIGYRNKKEVAIKGLKSLEYRGYDSAGIGFINDKVYVFKKVGRVDELKDIVNSINATLVIGHTRWATHGGVTEENAHPQTDCSNNIMVVHNGTIENVDELRLRLKNHKFNSETDTELIAHLLEEELKENEPLKALELTLNQLKGSYALVIGIKGVNKLLFAKQDSPLHIGLGKKEFFLASDIAAFVEYTRKFVPLMDGDYGYVSLEGYKIFNKGKEVKRDVLEINWEIKEVEKGGYPHFMLKEINEQVDVVGNALAVNTSHIEEMISNAGSIHIVAAGTSYHAGYLLKLLLEKYKGIESDIVIASEYIFTKRPNKDTVVIAVSQSGETADTLQAVKFAKRRGARIVGITNVMGSSLTYLSDEYAIMNAGLEVGVAATKTFTSQVAIAFKIVFGDRVNKEKIKQALTSSLNIDIASLAKKCINYDKMFFLGRGLSYPIAMEGALKFKELTYKHAEAYPGGELKHGPLSLMDEDAFVFAFMPEDETFAKMIYSVEEVKARGAFVAAASPGNVDKVDALLKVNKEEMPYQLFSFIPLLQLLAYRTSVLLGNDPDKPRNLAKSITVE